MTNYLWTCIVAGTILSLSLASRAHAGERREVAMSAAASGEKGVVYLIDGVGGFGLAPKVMETALAEAGVPHELRNFYWSHGFGRWHADLTDDENLRRKASELADSIMDLRTRSGRPVYIVAKSGGTAIALSALAQLPAESVERVVLLSSAVSPDYDLVPALRAVRVEVVSFWSPKDKFILGFGTSMFGTADGVMGNGAGLIGFRTPEQRCAADLAQYRKLRQVEWDESMRKTYNYGTHIGTSMPLFVRQYVAPLVGGRIEPAEACPR
jgi:pimeloyl-ACP methyl ester carboxylesterase